MLVLKGSVWGERVRLSALEGFVWGKVSCLNAGRGKEEGEQGIMRCVCVCVIHHGLEDHALDS